MLQTKEEVQRWVHEHLPQNRDLVKINADLTIDIDDRVYVTDAMLVQGELPVQFKEVQWMCFQELKNLVSLKGCALKCSQLMVISCPNLKSLKGAERSAVGAMIVQDCQKLETLQGGPLFANHSVQLKNLNKLKDLQGLPASTMRAVAAPDELQGGTQLEGVQ